MRLREDKNTQTRKIHEYNMVLLAKLIDAHQRAKKEEFTKLELAQSWVTHAKILNYTISTQEKLEKMV